MSRSASRPLELLAPAGSLEAFFAALDNGADAVYCGLKEFSARARAKNFTLAEVAQLTVHAHRQGKKLYVALNTLLKEAELEFLIEILAELAEIGVDGLIIQDLGVWRLARTHFPHLPLHASTQMTVHNGAGVRMLERMGFARAVLARELTLAEIAAIRQQSTIELEHFVHGALCFSVSGQCLFSSAVSGMSGNRGRCAQPCRRRFRHRDQTGYFFSTSDLCAIDLLPDLIAAGITSFKIEGRMKSGDYVARVVAAYRLVLDAPPQHRKEALREAGEHLALSYGRSATRGFLTGQIPAGITTPNQQGTLGEHLGEVVSLRGGLIGLTLGDRLHVGDRLRLQPKNDLAGTGFTVRQMLVGDREVRLAKAGDFVRVRQEGRGTVRIGDAVYKVGGRPLFTQGQEACRERLAIVPLSAGERTLDEQAAAQARAALLPTRPAEHGSADTSLTVAGRDLADLDILSQPGIYRLQLSLNPENLSAASRQARKLAAVNERLIWEIPPLLFGDEWQEYRRAVRMLYGQGFRLFRIANLGHLPLFGEFEAVKLLGGFRCYVLNSQAALAWQEMGLSELVAGIEDDRDNLSELCCRNLPLPFTVTVYAPLPVLLSRIPPRGIRSGSLLLPDKGEGCRVFVDGGLTEVVGEEDFSLLGHLAELRAIGFRRFLADLSHCGATTVRGQQVLAAFTADQPLHGTVDFNFRRGLA